MGEMLLINVLWMAVILIGVLVAHMYLKNKISLEKYKIDIQTPITQQDIETIDLFIANEFAHYIMINIEPIDKYKNGINSACEQKILNGVYKQVLESISPTMVTKILFVYGSLEKAISNKINDMVMAYAMEKNTPK